MRDYDKTHLSIDTAEDRMIVHRDYIAHCLRWSHVIKQLLKGHKFKTSIILDVGCGKDLPLAKALYSNKMTGSTYIGVDMNKLSIPDMLKKAVDNEKINITLHEQTDASTLKLDVQPSVITCFEVFEHSHPRIATQMIKNLYDISSDNAEMFFSTPCWNGKAAANHINEPKFEAMGAVLEQHGWRIKNYYGTFASQSDYKPVMNECESKIFERLGEYYDSNLLAVMLAPLFPQQSRNVFWHCVKDNLPRQFNPLNEVVQPWSQHEEYEELLND